MKSWLAVHTGLAVACLGLSRKSPGRASLHLSSQQTLNRDRPAGQEEGTRIDHLLCGQLCANLTSPVPHNTAKLCKASLYWWDLQPWDTWLLRWNYPSHV